LVKIKKFGTINKKIKEVYIKLASMMIEKIGKGKR